MRKVFIGSCSVFAIVTAAPAMAQTHPSASDTAGQGSANSPPAATDQTGAAASGTGLEEIVVTAQKRSENLQNVPISITAVSAAKLEANGIQSAVDLAAIVPGLQVPITVGSAAPHLRGVGNQAPTPGLENAVAVYVDGVYIASPIASLLSLNNIAQVEVLKGPQGTLFGRNATGGVISVTTRAPSDHLTGSAEIGYGNYNTINGGFYISGPVANNVASDLAVQVSHQGTGYGKNLYNGDNVYQTTIDLNVRSKTVAKLDDRTKLEVIFDYARNRGSAIGALRSPAGQIPLTGQPNYGNNQWNVNEDGQPFGHIEAAGASAKLTHDLDGATFTSITAYRASSLDWFFDYDITPVPGLGISLNSKENQFSQELQLSSSKPGPFKWTVGAFYFNNVDDATQLVGFAGPFRAATGVASQLGSGHAITNSLAGYAQATYEVLPGTNLTGGFRFTYEKRTLGGEEVTTLAAGPVLAQPAAPPSLTVNKPTWRIAIDHRFSSSALVYASYNRGFKSGGFNISAPLAATYQPEQLDAYEAGLKLDLLDRKLRINPSAFLYKYDNIQVTRFTPAGAQLYNGAKATIYGLDVDYEAVLARNFTISGGIEYLHTRFDSFPNAVISTQDPQGGYTQVLGDASGNQLPQSPKFVGSISPNYKVDLGSSGIVDLNASYEYNDGYFSEPDNRLRQAAYSMVGASIKWTSANERYFVRVWGKNLANAVVEAQLLTASQVVGLGLFAPRTFGITGGVKF